MRRMLAVGMTALSMIVVAAAALAQGQRAGAQSTVQQKVLPPEARYWMGATTGAGMMAMVGGGQRSIMGMMRMATSGPPSASQSVELRLGSSLAANGEADATHLFPAGAQVNKPIHLESPEPGKADTVPEEAFKEPKGQISFYWGCGEKAGPGQPVVLRFDKLMRGENEPELGALEGAVGAQSVRRPSTGNSKTFGQWPHADRKKRNRGLRADFPPGSTLAGEHLIEGSYSPRIAFTLPADRNFMDPVHYSSTQLRPSGALALAWNGVPRATGYSLGLMAPEKVDDDSANVVMWSSAERPATFIQMQFLTPAEVKRLIGLKAVLPSTTTSCTVPAEVVKATREGSILMFTAFGDESTFIDPPRPADPQTTWDQDWFARVSYKSVRMDMISPQGVTDMAAMMGGGTAAAPGAEMSDEDYCAQLERERAQRPAITDVIPGGRLLGKFARKQQDEAAADPRCAKPAQE